MLGRQVRVLVEGVREAGVYEVVFEASDLPSGTFLYRLETSKGSLTLATFAHFGVVPFQLRNS